MKALVLILSVCHLGSAVETHFLPDINQFTLPRAGWPLGVYFRLINKPITTLYFPDYAVTAAWFWFHWPVVIIGTRFVHKKYTGIQ